MEGRQVKNQVGHVGSECACLNVRERERVQKRLFNFVGSGDYFSIVNYIIYFLIFLIYIIYIIIVLFYTQYMMII